MEKFRIGSVCICQNGIIGIISKIQYRYTYRERLGDITKCKKYYTGFTLDGYLWESENPMLLAETVLDYMKQEQFDPDEIMR